MKVNYKLMNSLILLSIPIIMIYAILRKPVEVEMQVEASAPVPVPLPVQFQRREMQPQPPEYRSPPVKKYKPGHFQQVGILTNEAGETLPLTVVKSVIAAIVIIITQPHRVTRFTPSQCLSMDANVPKILGVPNYMVVKPLMYSERIHHSL